MKKYNIKKRNKDLKIKNKLFFILFLIMPILKLQVYYLVMEILNWIIHLPWLQRIPER